ncbi:unnamed protein product [Fraxinus pennsylvanica]|uniref:Uncharacterized protein n=1 Tax=Fraxinus pennsylvanica TaxID=56036 RepID=A0AAD1ZMG2_9LAMI|nr:unnamed protein product [Fraxinus pennsylvanica]
MPYSNSNANMSYMDINNMHTGTIIPPHLVSQSLSSKPMSNSLALVHHPFSLSIIRYIYTSILNTDFFGGLFFDIWPANEYGEVAIMEKNFELANVGGRRSKDEEHESRSRSDNMKGALGDDQDATDKPSRKKRYYLHTSQQIQELEA